MNHSSRFDSFWCIQEALHSAETLSVIVDSTFRSIDEMAKWKYRTKDEMKHLGGTLNQVTSKTRELLEIGCAKLVEDAFNNANEVAGSKLKPWSPSVDDLLFVKEVRRTRHIANIIKHHNSVVLRSCSPSGKALVDEYGFRDDEPLRYDFKPNGQSPREYLPTSIFYAYQFSFDLFRHLELFPQNLYSNEIKDIPKFMLNNTTSQKVC